VGGTASFRCLKDVDYRAVRRSRSAWASSLDEGEHAPESHEAVDPATSFAVENRRRCEPRVSDNKDIELTLLQQHNAREPIIDVP
jgi:hypothetical protein